MKRLSLIIVLILIVTASIAGQRIPENTYGSITGHVSDRATCNPIANAVVRIAGAVVGGAISDSDGRYTIANLPTDRYDLTCRQAGYIRLTIQGVEVKNGQVILDFSLEATDDSCHKLPPDSTMLALAPRVVRLAPLVIPRGADSDIFLCAAQVAGSSKDPWEQGDALKCIVNACCAAGKVDLAIQILEAIGDEVALAEAMDGIDSVSVDDRQALGWRRAINPLPELDQSDYCNPIKPFRFDLSLSQLQPLRKLAHSMTEPETRVGCAIKAGSLLAKYGSHTDAQTLLHSTLPVLDSVDVWTYYLDFGDALLAAGDTTTGLTVFASALTSSRCLYDGILALGNPDWATLSAIIETGSYDVALDVGSRFWDSTMVRSDIALSLARKGRCDEALKELETCPPGRERAFALEDVSVACALRGNRQAASVALQMAQQDRTGDSAWYETHSDYQQGDLVSLVYAYAKSGLLSEALQQAGSIINISSHCRALVYIGEELLKAGRRTEADSLIRHVILDAEDLQDPNWRDDAIESVARACLNLHELSLSHRAVSAINNPYRQKDILENLALGYVECDSCKEALAVAEEMNDPDERVDLKMSIADSCFAMGRKAIALKIVDEIGDSLSIGHPFVYSGEGYCAMTAISLYARAGEMEKAARLAKQWEHTSYEPAALMKMADGYIDLGEPRNALPLLSAARKACCNLRLEPNTQPPLETWQKITKLYVRAGAFAEALQTVRETNTSPRYASETLADLALAFSKTGRDLNSAEKAELQEIISQYCK
jgi:tetratricopeptide (TPR) repeat protein